MNAVLTDIEFVQELNRALIHVGHLGFIFGMFFGVIIGFVLHSLLEQYYQK